ncbi:MerR family transcriptional regulator [Saccharothrix sp. BKS2]|uniref:MerR family transcriptional regulator n=1 Tax=Saccharothrix sp. BKS2 TaxID=3064400 RepID=UPI0039ED8801
MSRLRRGRLADAAGVNPQTLRYYERIGLLAEPEQTLGGQRLYPPEAVTVLQVVKAAQRLGFTLGEVADLLETGRHRYGTRAPAGLTERVTAKLADVEARITDLGVIRDTLRTALAAGYADLVECSGTPSCPIPFSDLAGERPADAPCCPLTSVPAVGPPS